MTISNASRQRIRQRANFLCEYCHSSEEASASLFTFDHLIPQSLGGADDEDSTLNMNDDRHDDGSIQRARRLWIRGGWHPPPNDPQRLSS